MTRRSMMLAVGAMSFALWTPDHWTGSKAHAQQIVHDPGNHAQNVLTAARALEQIRNQVRQIEQATAMLRRNPLQLSPELSRSIGEARALLNDAQNLSAEARRVADQVRQLYPETWRDRDIAAVLVQSDRWLEESRRSVERAMAAEAHAAAAISQAQGRIDRALGASQDAEGQTGAIQAGNQLLGVSAAQLAEIHALLAAQGQALQAERMERIAREQRAREVQRRAFPTTTTPPPPARTTF
jgi:type IV secretion system protein TrbJ